MKSIEKQNVSGAYIYKTFYVFTEKFIFQQVRTLEICPLELSQQLQRF